MPATIALPSIPQPNGTNDVQVLTALRNAVIAMSNTDAGRANAAGTVPPSGPNQAMPSPSTFTVTSQVIVPVTYTTSSGATVIVPQLTSLVLTNNVTGETWAWTAPAKLTNGGVVGAAL